MPQWVYSYTKNGVSVENLKLYTWQAQLTIGIISLTLISLILNKLDGRVNGQPIKLFIMEKKGVRLGYLEYIAIIIFLSSINLMFIMYFGVLEVFINFSLTNFLIIILFVDTINIIFNKEKFKKISKVYIEKNIDKYKMNKKNELESILKNIRIDIGINIKISSKEIIENDINLLCEILNKIDDKNIFYIIKNIFENELKYLQEDNFNEFINIIISNLKENDKYNEIKIVIGELYIYKINLNKELYLDSALKFMSERLIYEPMKNSRKNTIIFAIFRNIYFNNENKYIDMEKFIDIIIPGECTTLNIKEIQDCHNFILIILKEFIIENFDYKGYKIIFEKIYKNNAFSIKMGQECEAYKIYIIVGIYFYYIIYRENIVNKKYKENIKEFLDIKVDTKVLEQIGVFEINTRISEIFHKSYNDIKNSIISSWEVMPYGEAKGMIMDNIIDEYYIMYYLVITDEIYYQDIFSDISIDFCKEILEWGNEEYNLKNEKLNLISNFKEIFNSQISQEEVNNKYKILREYANNFLVKNNISEIIELNNKDIIENNFKKDIITELKKNKLIKFAQLKDIPSYTYRVNLQKEILYDNKYNEKYYLNICKAIENRIFEKVETSLSEIYVEGKDKKLVEKIKNSIDIKDIYINVNRNLSEFSIFFREDTEENKECISELDKKCERYTLGSSKEATYIENGYKIELEIIDINIKEYSSEECINMLRKSYNKNYKKYIINNVMYEQDEAIKYILNLYNFVEVEFKLNLEDIKGFVIKFKV